MFFPWSPGDPDPSPDPEVAASRRRRGAASLGETVPGMSETYAPDLAEGETATGFEVLARGRRGARRQRSGRPVVVHLGAYEYRNTIAPMGGGGGSGSARSTARRRAARAGDEVDVELELDTAPREVEMPLDLAAALDADPEAKASSTGSLTATSACTR